MKHKPAVSSAAAALSASRGEMFMETLCMRYIHVHVRYVCVEACVQAQCQGCLGSSGEFSASSVFL